MDGDLFTAWLKELDRKFAAQDWKITLTVDNCRAHPIVDGLKAIELIFLPSNTTSKTQPMDQGVTRSLKVFYRHSIIKRYITSIDGGRSPTKVNVRGHDFANSSLGMGLPNNIGKLLQERGHKF